MPTLVYRRCWHLPHSLHPPTRCHLELLPTQVDDAPNILASQYLKLFAPNSSATTCSLITSQTLLDPGLIHPNTPNVRLQAPFLHTHHVGHYGEKNLSG